jgi:hypothetical protein
MPYQTQSNAYVAYKKQSGLGAQASGSGARVLRTTGGQYGRMTKAAVESNEVRRDGMRSRGRHGTQKSTGGYAAEASIALMDDVIEAVMRGTWATELVITQATASLASITTTTSTIVAGGGSWITAGLRVGDVVRLTNHSTAANNDRNLRIIGLTATVMTVAETLTANAVADTTFTITRAGRKLINPAAGALVRPYYTIEEHEIDIDGSEIFTDCRWTSLSFRMQPNGLLTVDTGWVGTGKFETQSAGSAPFFTTPTEPTGVPLSVADATIRMGSTDLVDLTSLDLTLDIGGNAPDVIASKFSPDVFDGQMAVSMNLTALRQDLLRVADYLNETVLSLHIFAPENEAEPKDFLSIFVPNFSLGSVDKSALAKEGGARTQTFSIPAALVGKDDTGGAFDPTMVKFQISNAS